MTLLDEIEKMKTELAGRELEGAAKDETVIEGVAEEAEEEENEPEAETTEEEKPEEIEKPKEELDNAGYARLRREAAAEKRRADQLEKELLEARKAREVPEEIIEQAPLPPEIQSVVEAHQVDRAAREFEIYENKAKQLHPEYGAVASEYAQAMYQSIKMQNRGKSEVELSEMTRKAILMQAGEYARAGYENPVEEMYHYAKELGFTGKSFQKEAPKEEKIQPDLNKVAENRKRSSGMTGNNGRSEAQMTMAVAATLPAAEWAKLPAAEKKRLMYGG